jgi:heat shock protein HslJ
MGRSALALAAMLVSCSESTMSPDGEGPEGSWELQAFQIASGPGQMVEPGLYTADFTAAGRVSARADCNRCSASYSAAGTKLEIGALACTRVYCGDGSLFDDYVTALDGATSFERSSADLVIRHPRATLRFIPRPPG